MNDDQLDDLLRDAARSYNAPPAVPREAMWARIEAARRAGAAPAPPPVGRRQSPWLRTGMGIAAVLLLGIAIGRASSGTPVEDGIAGPVGQVAVRPVIAGPDEVPTPGAPPAADGPSVADARGASAATNDGGARGGGRSAGLEPGRAPAPLLRLAAREPRGPRPSLARSDAGREGGRTYGVPRSTPGAVGDGTEMNVHRLAVVEHLARTEVLLTGFRAADQARGRTATAADAEQFGRLTRELLQNTRLLLATRATDDPLLTRLLEDLELVLMQIAQYAAEGGARRGDLDAINQSLDRRNVLPKLRSNIPAGVPAGS